MTAPITRLREYLESQPAGRVNASAIEGFLADCWPDLQGSSETGMQADKLYGRVEDPAWSPPELSFKIERHGATAMGSSRAELHEWTVNVQTGTAKREANTRRRQLYPMAKRLDVQPIARSLADAILGGVDDNRLERWPDGTVRLRISEIIPETNAQTTAGRRKRLRAALRDLLASHGWEEVRPNFFTNKVTTTERTDR